MSGAVYVGLYVAALVATLGLVAVPWVGMALGGTQSVGMAAMWTAMWLGPVAGAGVLMWRERA